MKKTINKIKYYCDICKTNVKTENDLCKFYLHRPTYLPFDDQTIDKEICYGCSRKITNFLDKMLKNKK